MTDIETLALRAVAFGLIQDRISAADRLNRQDLQAAMEINDRKAVRLPLAGVQIPIGTVTLAKPSVYASVSDEAALIEWLAANRPDELVTTVTVRQSFKDWLLAEARKEGIAVDSNGEQIPGITVRDGTSTVTVRRDKSTEAQAALVDYLFADGVAGVRQLLAIEPPAEPS